MGHLRSSVIPVARGPARAAVLAVAVLATAMGIASWAAPAQAATGGLLRHITAAGSCPASAGIAFDGRDLFVTCAFSNVVDVVRTSDGGLVRRITVAGATDLGAASFDRRRGQLLACNGTFINDANNLFEARLIDPATGASVRDFFTRGCPFGLAADASDDTVYASASGSCTIDHHAADGTLLASHDVCALGAATPSGLAVGARQLLSGGFGGGVYAITKDFSSASRLFGTTTAVTALACDDVTFAPKSAVWVEVGTVGNRALDAYEIPAGSCPYGGGASAPTTKEQCKSGGWRAFPQFRNQGECVAFVERGPKR